MSEGIAIVGMACRFPDASSPYELWENVLAKRRAFRRLPKERLNLDDYYSEDLFMPDSIYATEAAVIEGYEFDRAKFQIPGSTFRATDMTHWMALDTAAQALKDAGFANGEGLPRDTTGVLVGNTLTGEFSRASLMRLRWAYVARSVDRRLRKQGWDNEQRREFLSGLEQDYKAPFEPVGEESLAGGLSNTIAGRICNHFDLGGGGYTVDGACSSSLLAVALACERLMAGDLDMVIAGGVDLSLDPFELVGFSKAGVLARDEMRVFDQRSNGFWPGEGCGMVVLTRASQARALALRSYAQLNGWGISSDGGSGITRPKAEGQELAMRRAYKRAGYNPDSVSMFECHGTGTVVGDSVELRALNDLRHEVGATRHSAVVGSVKANIGHTKAAAGAAGLIKAVMALQEQILPPATAVECPHEVLQAEDTTLRLLQQGELWPQDRPLRAGVSSFGFGGINCHLTLEADAVTRRNGFRPSERLMLDSEQDVELFLLSAEDSDGLLSLVQQLTGLAPRLSRSDLIDLAAQLATEAGQPEGWRGAVLAATPQQLGQGLLTLQDWLSNGRRQGLDTDAGVYLGSGEQRPRLAWLFPGQAAPVRFDGGTWGRRFDRVRRVYTHPGIPLKGDVDDTAVAQPLIVAAELAGLELLRSFGLEADVAMGHSLGELAALYWGGAWDDGELLDLTAERGRLMAASQDGGMSSFAAPLKELRGMLERHTDLVVSCINGPQTTVLSGPLDALESAECQAREFGWNSSRLNVGAAFHSPAMAPAAAGLRTHLEGNPAESLQHRVISTVTGEPLESGQDLAKLLVEQLCAPVRFVEAMDCVASEVELCIEVGPGQMLSSLASQWLPVPVLSLDVGGESLRGLFSAVGAAFALGAPLCTDALFGDRLWRPFDIDRPRRFLANPCEQDPADERGDSVVNLQPSIGILETPAVLDGQGDTPVEILRAMIAAKAELPLELVSDDARLLVDLHLNSIKVGELMAEASRRINLPPPSSIMDYADATLAQLAEVLEDRLAAGEAVTHERKAPVTGVEDWVRAFTVTWRPAVLPSVSIADYTGDGEGLWRLLGDPESALREALLTRLARLPGNGVVLCLPAGEVQGSVPLLLEAAKLALSWSGGGYWLQWQPGAAAAAFARTLKQEQGSLKVCVLDMPFDADSVGHVLDELLFTRDYNELTIDGQGKRLQRQLALYEPAPVSADVLGEGDLLLVSGGGKGIAAECALALARKYGVRMALMGRSNPDEDVELAQNLAHFDALGLPCRYLQADVGDAKAVSSAVTGLIEDCGPVTAILHAAGNNRPGLINTLGLEDYIDTLEPKVQGLQHLLAAVDVASLRLLLGFGSIIAEVGLAGESHYALANQALQQAVVEHASGHPHCRCLTLEWSLWSDVGMGPRLGSVERLRSQGISPITPDQGIDWLLRLVADVHTEGAVVISGRMGDLPTLTLERPELPFRRFLERTLLHYPGIELVAEAELSAGNDPYLSEHSYQGEDLLPAVMGMEAMAQAAQALVGSDACPVFESLALSYPIVVGAGGNRLRICSLMEGEGKVRVVLRAASSGFHRDHFSAVLRFDLDSEQTAVEDVPAMSALALQPGRDLYGPRLFHTGRFHRLRSYSRLGTLQCTAELDGAGDKPWFGRYLPATLVLGDTALRDAAIHGLQACLPHARLLPTAVQRWIPGALDAPGPWIMKARQQWRDGPFYTYDLELVAADGRLRERWQGLQLREVEALDTRGAWVCDLFTPYLERRVSELSPGAALDAALLHDGDADAREKRSGHALAIALGRPLSLLYRSDGRPELNDGVAVSTSHNGGLTLAIAGHGPLACDIEAVVAGRPWVDLLGSERLSLAGWLAEQSGEDLDRCATRLWCAGECLKKAGLPANTTLAAQECADDGWLVLDAHGLRLLCWCGEFEGCGSPMAVAVAVPMDASETGLDAIPPRASGSLVANEAVHS